MLEIGPLTGAFLFDAVVGVIDCVIMAIFPYKSARTSPWANFAVAVFHLHHHIIRNRAFSAIMLDLFGGVDAV